jgi:hypothetical protein
MIFKTKITRRKLFSFQVSNESGHVNNFDVDDSDDEIYQHVNQFD